MALLRHNTTCRKPFRAALSEEAVAPHFFEPPWQLGVVVREGSLAHWFDVLAEVQHGG